MTSQSGHHRCGACIEGHCTCDSHLVKAHAEPKGFWVTGKLHRVSLHAMAGIEALEPQTFIDMIPVPIDMILIPTTIEPYTHRGHDSHTQTNRHDTTGNCQVVWRILLASSEPKWAHLEVLGEGSRQRAPDAVGVQLQPRANLAHQLRCPLR